MHVAAGVVGADAFEVPAAGLAGFLGASTSLAFAAPFVVPAIILGGAMGIQTMHKTTQETERQWLQKEDELKAHFIRWTPNLVRTKSKRCVDCACNLQ